MFDIESFEAEKEKDILSIRTDDKLQSLGREFLIKADKLKYAYSWTWLGLPIIQMPEDILITQEILWDTKPDFVIEAGIAWGGGIAMYASFLEIMGRGKVFGIDLTIPLHNRNRIMSLPVSDRIELIEGSSVDQKIYNKISSEIPQNSNVLLILDSNHTHDHVLEELKLWSPLITKGNVIIVSDTIVESIPEQTHRIRPWGHGNNPMTAMRAFLENRNDFLATNKYSDKTVISYNPSGYLLKK